MPVLLKYVCSLKALHWHVLRRVIGKSKNFNYTINGSDKN